jgi:hypothetical protein
MLITRRYFWSLIAFVAITLAACGHDHDTGEVAKLYLLDRGADSAEVADVHGEHWHGNLPTITVGDNISIGGRFVDENGKNLTLGSNEGDLQIRARVADGQPTDIVRLEFHGDHVEIFGEKEGQTRLVFQLWHDNHADWESPAIRVRVEAGDHDEHGHGDHDHGDEDHGDEDHDNHDHANHDDGHDG